jgi:CRISPR-associated endoribonuclease Cas6
MRFGVKVRYKEPFVVSTRYRKKILAFIKEALGRTDEGKKLKEKYFEGKKNYQKPYTFSVFFPNSEAKEGKLIVNGKEIRIFFSSNDIAFFICLYNGIRQLSDYDPLSNGISPSWYIYPIKQERIMRREVIFRTLSPVLIRDYEGRKGRGFIGFDDSKFLLHFKYNIITLADVFLGKEINESDIEIDILEAKKVSAFTYGGEIGNKMVFGIKCDSDVINLIYDIGVGAKRSQGYGMLEVVK